MDTLIAQNENAVYYPNMELAQKLFRYEGQFKSGSVDENLQQEVLKELYDNKMVTSITLFASKYGWTIDQIEIDSIIATNEKSIRDFDKKIADAGQLGGDTEVLDSLFEKARFYTKIGQWTEAFTVYDEILAKPKSSTGKKIDALMEKARISSFNMDIGKLNEFLTEAKKFADLGGDWDRRNRLKVYEALTLLATRDFKSASSLFIDGISTFSCVEMCSYDQFIFYAVVICVVALPRTDLYKKIISNPQIISVIRTQPELQTFLMSLYRCEYKTFFQSFNYLYKALLVDRYLFPHIRYLMKEYRIIAYAQYLEAYKSVVISSMADAFGISIELLDRELAHFISVGRLSARIDKVGGIVVSSRSDTKNAQYHETIKKGDTLLNQIQKLVRVIDV